ncbi:MAG: glycosyltransferase family 4 protein [Chloroflexota bacterium]
MKVALVDHSSSLMMYDHCLAEALVAQGCEVLFLGSDYLYSDFDHPRSYQTRDHFYRRTNRLLRKWKALEKFRKPIRVIEYIFDMISLVRLLKRFKPDAIHFETLPLPIVDSWFIPRFKRIARVVVTAHDTSPRNESRVQFWGFFRCLRLFDHIITLTSFSKHQVIAKAGVPDERVTVVPHGNRMQGRFYGMPSSNKLGEHSDLSAKTGGAEKVVLFFGVIKPYKGLDVLIAALSNLPEDVLQKCRLVIAGMPFMDVEPLQRQAAELGVNERITWDLRYIPDEEVWSYFAEAAVAVFPYREIDQSGAFHIAIEFEKPLIATDIGGFPEFVTDGVDGYLVPAENTVALAHALERVLADEEQRHQMSLAVGRLADSLSWGVISHKTVSVYKTPSVVSSREQRSDSAVV